MDEVVKKFEVKYRSVDGKEYLKTVFVRNYEPIEKFLNQVYDVDHPIVYIKSIEMDDAFHDIQFPSTEVN